MKVLKPGRDQNGPAVEAYCTGDGNGGGGCNALLLVEEGDVFETSKSSTGETDCFTTFKCPSCGTLTDLKGRHPFRNVRERTR